jgi:hypothetical protein
MGAIFGPVSYYSGAKIGAVTLIDPLAAMIALSVTWGLMLPGLLLLAKRLDGTTLTPASDFL